MMLSEKEGSAETVACKEKFTENWQIVLNERLMLSDPQLIIYVLDNGDVQGTDLQR